MGLTLYFVRAVSYGIDLQIFSENIKFIKHKRISICKNTFFALMGVSTHQGKQVKLLQTLKSVADPGPSPVQISHKKDGRQRISCFLAPHYPAAGSDAASTYEYYLLAS